MSKLIPVIYRKLNYPVHIKANIREVRGNFDIENISVDMPYSLHTEYSYRARNFNPVFFKDFNNIISAQQDGIPLLWYNVDWSIDFFHFIVKLIDNNYPPVVLEIHPPFNNYYDNYTFDTFLDIFKVFQEKIKEKYPKDKFPPITFLLENRFGTRKKGGRFLLQYCSDVLNLCSILNTRKDIELKIVLDYPQLIGAETKMDFSKFGKITRFNEKLLEHNYMRFIGGFHMWGKKKIRAGYWEAHKGNFDNFFCDAIDKKKEFLKSIFSTFNDGMARYFVPEINSKDDNDLFSIVKDMENIETNDEDKKGFVFI